jgi:UDP-N-acetyl-D-mannosaminuronic acid dehydrogenase
LTLARPDLTFPPTHAVDSDIRIAYCPERVLPGSVLRELVNNDRVIGGLSSKCSESASSLYKIFVKGDCVLTNVRTAEMCKLTENSFRDVNIAFANELSIICKKLGINVWELISLANRHPRVNVLQPGPGVGGHCIAVDPWFIVSKTPDEARLIRAAREVNDGKPEWVVAQVKTAIADYLLAHPTRSAQDITVACYGLTFKADIDDLRESPALEITHYLAQIHPGNVWAVEPNIAKLPSLLLGKVELKLLEDALANAQIQVLLVDHKQFKAVEPFVNVNQRLIDTRGIWNG